LVLRLQPETLVRRAIKIPANSPHPLASCSAASGCPPGSVRFSDTVVDRLCIFDAPRSDVQTHLGATSQALLSESSGCRERGADRLPDD